MPTTPNGAPYPALNVTANVPSDIQALAEWADTKTAQMVTDSAGRWALRPRAGSVSISVSSSVSGQVTVQVPADLQAALAAAPTNYAINATPSSSLYTAFWLSKTATSFVIRVSRIDTQPGTATVQVDWTITPY